MSENKDKKSRKDSKEGTKNEVKTKISKITNISFVKSICKISYETDVGSGFLIKLEKQNTPLYCLMSNEHVINKEMISKKKKIKVSYNNESKEIEIELDTNKRFIKDYTYIDIDAVVVEILKKDKIHEDYFLLPNEKYINNYNELLNKTIYILQFPGGGDLSYSEGTINSVKSYQLSYSSSTEHGSSGSPIFLKEDDSLVIGIHKAGNEYLEENYGNFIGPIIDSLKNNYFRGRYEGEFAGGESNIRAEGYGKLTYYINNTYYIGQFLNGLKHGKGAEYDEKDEIIYEGEFKNGKTEGFGRLNFSFLTDKKFRGYYIGQFKNSLPHGKGTLYNKNDKIIYKGDFAKNKKNGKGRMNYEDGTYYIGEFLNNVEHGEGKIFNNDNKIIYEGDFKNGEKNGNGKFYFKDGSYYKGEFLSGVFHGKGIIYNEKKEKIYEGDFKNGVKHGKGKLKKKDGTYYEGQFFNNFKHGKGKIYNENKEVIYKGEFLNGKKMVNLEDDEFN